MVSSEGQTEQVIPSDIHRNGHASRYLFYNELETWMKKQVGAVL